MPHLQSVSQNFSKGFIMLFRTFLAVLSARYFNFILFLLIHSILYLIPINTYAAQLTIGWDASGGAVAGYTMHYGTKSGHYDYSIDVGNSTSCTISGLQEGATYYFAVTAYNGSGESDYSDELVYTIGDTIPLPSGNAYGKIKGGDQSHIDKVNYSFGGLSGNVTLNYEAWDVDYTKEVEIILNGTHIGYAPKTGNDSWGGVQTITLPDALVNDSSDNYLTFNHTANPPKQWYWGVRNVSVDLN